MLPIIHKKLRKDREKNGKCPIVLQVYYNNQRKQFFTGVMIDKDFWDERNQNVTNKHPEHEWLNRAIKNEYEKIEKEYFKQSLSNEEITLDIKEKDTPGSFFKFAIEYYEGMKNRVSEKYLNKCIVAINDFKKFTGEKSFKSITSQTLKEYEDHLFNQGLHRNTINWKFKKLKQAFKAANATNNPFTTFKAVTYKQPKRDFLTVDEIRLLEKVDLPVELDFIRNYFLLSCHIGLRFGDAKNFDKEKYIIKNKGVERIIITTEKGAEQISIKLSKPVKDLINKLDRKLISNSQTNRMLKIIGKLAGIDKPLNFHLSRHTAAVNMASAGLPIEAVARILGHKSIRTTGIYYKITDSAIDDYMDKFNDFIKK